MVIRQGEPGDRFYAIERGTLSVEIDEKPVRELEAGDYFGEIALLRNTPRTATVRVVTEASLVTLGRDEFLAAVTDHVTASRAAMDAVGERLGRDRDGAPARGRGSGP